MVIVQCVVNGFAFAAEAHQLGVLQHTELMAHSRLAQLHRVCDVLHAQLVVVQCVQDFDAGGVAKHPEKVGQLVQHLVVGHFHRVGVFRLCRVDLFQSCHSAPPLIILIYEHLFMCS